MEDGLEVCPVLGKGLGVMTTRSWQQGELLAMEQPIVMLKDGHNQDAEQRFCKRFSKFDPETKLKLLALYDSGEGILNSSCDDDSSKAWRIFCSNTMEVGLEDNAGLENIAALYPTLSRINHSCQCNTYQSCSGMLRTVEVEIIAGRDLVKGEEVTLNYLGLFQRPNVIHFKCTK